ncbi:MAG: methyltransferase domain-containing protein [Planctomycetota bacterium]|nr:MAG: methyltransferase domain-containing protein [Planctomycetota bacterium]
MNSLNGHEDNSVFLHDRINDAYYGKLGKELMDSTRKRLNWICQQVSGNRILDVGCSQGITSILLGREEKSVLGLDVDASVINDARNHLNDEEAIVQKNVEFYCADFLSYNFEDNKFETILITEVLEHLQCPEEFISQAHRLLVQGGRLIITVPFGINDFPDHKHTFYLLGPYSIIYPYFSIDSVCFLGKWIGFASTARDSVVHPKKQHLQIPEEILSSFEANLASVENEYHQMLKETRKRLDKANIKYRELSSNIDSYKRAAAKSSEEAAKPSEEAKKLKERQAELLQQIEEANTKNTELRNEKKKIEEKLLHLRKQHAALRKNAADTTKALSLTTREKRAAISEIIALRESLAYRTGVVLRNALSSFSGFCSLPGDLLGIVKEYYHARRAKKDKQRSVRKPTVRDALSCSLKVKRYVKHKQTDVETLKELKIACIMDTFSFVSFSPEANFLQLTPQDWEDEMRSFMPDLLFVESAWRGKDDLWHNLLSAHCAPLLKIIAWCNEKHIPTAFWNKEDPVHFNTFINLAAHFDYIFTTDIDCLGGYKHALGHDRVFLLPFAAQPALTNPVEKYERKNAFCFAGAYYVRYPERANDLSTFIDYLSDNWKFEIYDRNYGKDDENYAFPPEYEPYIIGTLPFDEIDKAYKGYEFAVNMNSIKQSQTMFARRVCELMASNTLAVSNYSHAVRMLFGDLVVCTDDGEYLVSKVKGITDNQVHLRKHKLAALRKVLSEHTYECRLRYVANEVFDGKFHLSLPLVCGIAFVKNEEELNKIQLAYVRQTYPAKALHVFCADENLLNTTVAEGVALHGQTETESLAPTLLSSGAEWYTVFFPKDYYGENFLQDIMLARCYCDARIIGKAAHYDSVSKSKEPTLLNDKLRYRETGELPIRASVFHREILENEFEKLNPADWESHLLRGRCFSVDEFNYCKNSSEPVELVNDLDSLDCGIDMPELLDKAKKAQPCQSICGAGTVITGKQLAEIFGSRPEKRIVLSCEGEDFFVESTLEDGTHEYLTAMKDYSPSELGFTSDAKTFLEVGVGLNIMLVLYFLDGKKQRIGHAAVSANENATTAIPEETAWIRFGLRVSSSGAACVRCLELSHREPSPSVQLGKSGSLLLTNFFPAYDDIYRNGFVHSRVRKYRDYNVNLDVFCLKKGDIEYREFAGVEVIEGSEEFLRAQLSDNRYSCVLVHFLNEHMWRVLKTFLDRVKVVVWIHGAEIQPWHRRDFNYQTESERKKAKALSDTRMAFWRMVFQSVPENLKFVFVSQYFADEVMEDVGIRLPDDAYAMIHNPIDTGIFKFHEKPADQRKKILSIRPYASKKYANDLSVEAILKLSEKPFFHELEFRMIGRGKLFEETLAPLRKFSNVTIEERFLLQQEMAELYRDYGVCLCPSRMDAQGVSRDEAMASGLVPITNAVAAIPEFVDSSCGILASGEDAQALADGIEFLYNNPESFLKMSKASADRVRSDRSSEIIIPSELKLFHS